MSSSASVHAGVIAIASSSRLTGRRRTERVYFTIVRSSWSLGILMIAMGGLSVGGIAGRRPLGPAYVIAALLVTGGVAMLTKRPFAFYVALAGAAVTAISGLLPYLGHPEL